jgi:chitodextrinase
LERQNSFDFDRKSLVSIANSLFHILDHIKTLERENIHLLKLDYCALTNYSISISGINMTTKHHAPVRMIKKGRFQLPILAGILTLVVAAGIFVVTVSHGASGIMSVLPATTGTGLGSSVTVTVRLNTGTTTVNALEADLVYPTDKLQYVSYDNTGGAFALDAASPSTSNPPTPGTLRFARSIQGGNSPVSGDNLVFSVTFRAIGIGSANVDLSSSSVALASTDSSNVLTIRNGSVITISDVTPPSVPGSLSSPTKSLSSINLSWTGSTDNVGVTGYKIYRGGTQVGTSASLSYIDSNLSPNSNYTYTVAAYDAAGNTSPQSSALVVTTLPDTTPPSSPTGLAASNRTLTAINLTWAAATDNVGVTGYRIYRGNVLLRTIGATTYYSDSSLTPGTTYSYYVTAIDAAGNASPAPGVQTLLSTLPDTIPPTAPTALSAGTRTGTSVVLSWTPGTDNVGVTGYKVYRDGTQISATTTNSGTFALPTTAGNYSYYVISVDGAGNVSPASSPLVISTFGPADVNQDGKVNIVDLSLLLGNWGKSGTGDINGDGTVSIVDLSLLLGAWTP